LKIQHGIFVSKCWKPYSWQLKKKSTIVLSNIKMEYMVVANAIKEVIWLQKLTFNFGFSPLQSIPFIVITNHALS
jgi:hypothetical protein